MGDVLGGVIFVLCFLALGSIAPAATRVDLGPNLVVLLVVLSPGLVYLACNAQASIRFRLRRAARHMGGVNETEI